MAKIKADLNALNDLVTGMTDLAVDIDDIADDILDAAAPQMEQAYRSAIESAATRGYSTGATAGSVSSTGARQNGYGHFVAVRATGSDSKGVSNAMKVALLEYGTSRQAARPVISQAVASVEGSLTEQVRSAVEAKVGEYCKQ